MADDVRARKLQPIYNALDARNYKMAIKLCTKKDLERWDIVKTLKAHALERLGKVEEALEVCAEVAAHKPTDETVLNTLVLTYKLTGHTREAIACYEAALAQETQGGREGGLMNMENGRELVYCYVRGKEWGKAQLLAIRLYKQCSSLPPSFPPSLRSATQYLFWAGTMMFLKEGGREGGRGGGEEEGVRARPMLALAVRMVQKGLEERERLGGRASGEEVGLYVMLLEEQGEDERALEALRKWGGREGGREGGGEQGKAAREEGGGTMLFMSEREQAGMEGGLLSRLRRWEEAAALHKTQVEKHPDQWQEWVGLQEAWRERGKEGGKDGGMEEELVFMKRLQAVHPLCRGPHLAELEWRKRRVEGEGGGEGGGGGEEGEGGRVVAGYVTRFGRK
ncbi:hypothetical protein VYU27_008660 [Nannochloropsis oceanica]